MRGKTLKTILVIEEQEPIRNLFVEGLKTQGFCPIAAENGRVGVQLTQHYLPDLITCGIMIPDIDGYDVLTTLRQAPATAIIPFIFVTAKDDRTALRRAMELGANDYLTKPCTVEELVRAIAAQFEKQNVLQQWYTSQAQSSARLSVTEAKLSVLPTEPYPEWVFPSDPQLRKVFHFIEANYHRPITLSDVAQAVGYSAPYLTSLMGRRTGQTVQRWIIDRRMMAARSLLLETDLPIEQIAAQVGYHHSVHFFRQFRQLHQVTPNSWRNAQRLLRYQS